MPRRQLPLVLVLAALCGAFLARVPQFVGFFSAHQSASAAVDEARELIRTRFVESVSDEQLSTGAITGMAESLNDPYSVYIPATKVGDFNKDLLGQFVGIGATVRKLGPHVLIVTPLPNSPALLAGLRPGDRITAIEDESVAALTIDQCIAKLKGVPGTQVSVEVLRGLAMSFDPTPERDSEPAADAAAALAGAERLTVKLSRAELNVSPVRGFAWNSTLGKWDFLIDPARRIAYIRIEQFSGHASDDVQAALDDMRRTLDPQAADARWLKGLILDLRDNPGGLLEDAANLCDMFMDSGTIVSTRSRIDAVAAKTIGRLGDVITANPGDVLPGAAIAILVNGRSASASEVVSGALSEQTPPRAIIVGTRTFGKGLVQATEPLSSGGILKLTEQFYFLPSGRLIQRKDDSATWGVDPTPGFFVPISDAQLIATLTARDTLEAVWPVGTAPALAADSSPTPPPPLSARIASERRFSDPAWVTETIQDMQLAAAIAAVQVKVNTGVWTPPGDASAGPATAQNTGNLIRTAERTALERSRERLVTELERIDRRLDAIEGTTPEASAPSPTSPTNPAGPALDENRPLTPPLPSTPAPSQPAPR